MDKIEESSGDEYRKVDAERGKKHDAYVSTVKTCLGPTTNTSTITT